MQVKQVIIDVLKPHDPSIIVYAEKIASLKSVDGVTIHVVEIDEHTETLEITVEGGSLNYKSVQKTIEKMGGSIHSVDQVSAGSRVVPRVELGVPD